MPDPARTPAFLAQPDRRWLRAAAACGFLAVALGAFGAHGLKESIEAAGTREWWDKAVLYHLAHAVAALAAVVAGRYLSAGFFLAGTAVFCGTLYAMALGAPRWLGAVTPLGGIMLLAGWLCIARSEPRGD
jgi:uncharacterized membrane protein YgdD (TMEM256/DUF423 family)